MTDGSSWGGEIQETLRTKVIDESSNRTRHYVSFFITSTAKFCVSFRALSTQDHAPLKIDLIATYGGKLNVGGGKFPVAFQPWLKNLN